MNDPWDLRCSPFCLFDKVRMGAHTKGFLVDGGFWRTQPTSPSSDFEYPKFLLNDDVITGVKGMKKSKL